MSGNIRKFRFSKYKKVRQVAIYAICSIVDVLIVLSIYQGYEYASSSKYVRVLKKLLVLNMLGFWMYQSPKCVWIYLSWYISSISWNMIFFGWGRGGGRVPFPETKEQLTFEKTFLFYFEIIFFSVFVSWSITNFSRVEFFYF